MSSELANIVEIAREGDTVEAVIKSVIGSVADIKGDLRSDRSLSRLSGTLYVGTNIFRHNTGAIGKYIGDAKIIARANWRIGDHVATNMDARKCMTPGNCQWEGVTGVVVGVNNEDVYNVQVRQTTGGTTWWKGKELVPVPHHIHRVGDTVYYRGVSCKIIKFADAVREALVERPNEERIWVAMERLTLRTEETE